MFLPPPLHKVEPDPLEVLTSACTALLSLALYNPASARRVVIDHQYLPHIVDRIWDFMPYPSLFRCTMVCKEWNADAKERLAEHAALLECNEPSHDVVVKSRHPLWPDYSTVLLKTWAWRDKDRDERFENFYQLIKTIDVVPDPSRHPSEPYDPDRVHRTHHPERARFYIPPGAAMFQVRHLTAASAVCFLDYSTEYPLSRATGICVPDFLTLSIDCYSDPTVPFLPLATYPTAWFMEFCTVENEVKRLTIILNNAIGQEPPRRVDAAPRAGDDKAQDFDVRAMVRKRYPWLGILFEVVRMALWIEVHAIYIVGAETFMCDAAHVAYVRHIREGLDSEEIKFKEELPDVDEETLGQKVRFWTHAQYRAQVGEEQYRMETIR